MSFSRRDLSTIGSPGRPTLRVALVGDASQVAAWAPDAPSGGIEPLLVDLAAGIDPESALARLSDVSPDVVIVFRPDLVPAENLARIDAATIGYLTEPLAPGDAPNVERARFDRIIAAEAAIAGDAELAGLPVWRVLMLPVADRFYRPVRAPGRPPRVLQVAPGLEPENLNRVDVAVNAQAECGALFEHPVLVCMAAGLLVLSEPLSSVPGLEPDIDFVEIDGELQLRERLETLQHDRSAFRRQQLGGRMKTETMRASRVWSRVVGDLRRDLAAFGRGR